MISFLYAKIIFLLFFNGNIILELYNKTECYGRDLISFILLGLILGMERDYNMFEQ